MRKKFFFPLLITVFGALSILTAFFYFYCSYFTEIQFYFGIFISLILSLAGIIVSIITKKGPHSALRIIGLIMSIFSFCVCGLYLLLLAYIAKAILG